MERSFVLKRAVHVAAGLVALAATPAAAATFLPALGAAAPYTVLYTGTGGHNLQITNDTVSGSIGVGGTGHVQFSGPGVITGVLDFSAPNTGQYSNSNPSNVGPSSVVFSDPAVTNALNAISTLSGDVSGGTNIAFTNAGEIVDESSGFLETVDGVTSRVFNVTAYSANNASILNIVGDGSGDPVVFNFGVGAGEFGQHNVNLGGSVEFSGAGLTNSDQVLFNFQSTSQNIDLTDNGETFRGIILATLDKLSMSHTNLYGRFYGGDSDDMQIESGGNVFGPSAVPEPAAWATLLFGLFGLGATLRGRRTRTALAP